MHLWWKINTEIVLDVKGFYVSYEICSWTQLSKEAQSCTDIWIKMLTVIKTYEQNKTAPSAVSYVKYETAALKMTKSSVNNMLPFWLIQVELIHF